MKWSANYSKIGITYLLPILGATITAFGLFVAWPFTVDDAFISFRYARNLAEGNGLVWNPGLDPVEGYTNFLWVIICSLFEYFLGTSEIAAKISGVLSLLFVLFIVVKSVYSRTSSTFLSIFAISGILLFPPTYYHSVSGLETMFYTLLIVAIFEAGSKVLEDAKESYLWFIPLLGLLLGLTRPEGLLPAAVVFGFAYSSISRSARRRLLIYTGVAAIPAVLYMLWRVEYFGHLLPNTFYVKSGGGLGSMFVSSTKWLIEKGSSVIAILSAYLINIIHLDNSFNKKVGYNLSFILSITVVYFVLTPGMDYIARFIYPSIPVLTIVLASSFEGTLDKYKGILKNLSIPIYIVIMMGAISLNMLSIIGLYNWGLANAHIRLGKALHSVEIPDEKKTLAVMDAGAVPYYSKWVSYDLLKLNSEFLAHGGTRLDLINNREPSLLILNSEERGKPRSYMEEVTRDYKHVASFRSTTYYLNVHIKKGLKEEYSESIIDAIAQPSKRSLSTKDWSYGPVAVVDYTLWRFRSLF